MASHYINKKSSGVLVSTARRERHMVLKGCQDPRKPRDTGILLNLQLVHLNCYRKTPSQFHFIYLQLHSLCRNLASQKRNKWMTSYEAKFMRWQVLNLTYCIKHFTGYKKRVGIMEVCGFGKCVKITAYFDFNWMSTDDTITDFFSCNSKVLDNYYIFQVQ